MEIPYRDTSIVKMLLMVLGVGWLCLVMVVVLVSIFFPSALVPYGFDVRFNAFYVCNPSITTSNGLTKYQVMSTITQTDTIYVCSDVTNLTPEKSIDIRILLFRDNELANIMYVDQILEIEKGTFVTPLEHLSLTEGVYRIEARKGNEKLTEFFFRVIP